MHEAYIHWASHLLSWRLVPLLHALHSLAELVEMDEKGFILVVALTHSTGLEVKIKLSWVAS